MGFLKRVLLAVIAAGGLAFVAATPAAAQATRTWVSGVGDDANPCSRTAPCKTFAGAISKTTAAGEINCLDPGGWGAVTITKAITIDCSQFPGGILNSGTPGIIVSAGVNDVVTLRGLEIQGVGTGTTGIRFLAGAALIVENVVIRGSSASNGYGIAFIPNVAARLSLKNVSITNNGTGGTGGGVGIIPTAGATVVASLNDVLISNNGGAGLVADSSQMAAGGALRVNIRDSSVNNNTGAGIMSMSGASGTAVSLVAVERTSSSGNSGAGLSGDGAASITRVLTSVVTGNGVGVQATNGSFIASYGDNAVFANVTAGAFNPASPISKQ